jgi:hypothetical protein
MLNKAQELALFSFYSLLQFFTQSLHGFAILWTVSGTYPENSTQRSIEMKKTLLIVAVMVLAFGALGVGVAFAQGGNPPTNPFGRMMGGRGDYGQMHTYVLEAFAAKLNLSVDTVNTRLEAGETMYEIALSQGITSADLPAFMSEIHKTAFATAVKEGVMTQAQVDFMLQRMSQNGYGTGTCPMGGEGYGYARGMMGGWGRSQNQNQNP